MSIQIIHYIQGLSIFTILCNFMFRSQFATLLIPYIEQPISQNIWFTGNYIIDYTNPKHNFGSLAHLFAVGNEQTGGPSVFYLQVNNHALGRTIGQMAVNINM